MEKPSSSNDNDNNLTWHPHKVSRSDRWKGHKGCIVWLTGLSACGKSTIANEVDYLLSKNFKTYLLDGDNIRQGLCKDLGFSAEDRAENIRRIGEVAKLMADAGLVVLCAFISPYRSDRDQIRESCPDDFVEVYVKASLKTCEGRDPKGLYQKARAGVIKNFTGVDDPYEDPLNPQITLDSDNQTIPQLAQQVVQWLKENEKLET